MRAALVTVLVIILLASGLAGYYLYHQNNTQQSSSSSSTTKAGNNGSNNGSVNQCTNGTMNYPSCTVCPAGQNLIDNHCNRPSGSCTNGADNPGCTSCPAGQTYAGTGCYPNCANGNANPQYCDNTTPNCHDPADIQSHLYAPARLRIVNPCITVSGTVTQNGGINTSNPDGDTHVSLNVDQQYASLVNAGDKQYISGHLLTEVVCAHPGPAYPSTCRGYTSQITIPKEKQHVIITGPYVEDTNHYNWGEIHPVYSLTIEYEHNTTITENLTISYPNGESNGWLGPRNTAHSKIVVVRDMLQLTEVVMFNNTSSSPEEITGIYVNTHDLDQLSMVPSPPIRFGPGEAVKVTLTIGVPYWYYAGPVDLYVVTG